MKIYRGCNARFQYRILRNVLVPKYWYMCNVMMQIIILFLGTCIVHMPYTMPMKVYRIYHIAVFIQITNFYLRGIFLLKPCLC